MWIDAYSPRARAAFEAAMKFEDVSGRWKAKLKKALEYKRKNFNDDDEEVHKYLKGDADMASTTHEHTNTRTHELTDRSRLRTATP